MPAGLWRRLQPVSGIETIRKAAAVMREGGRHGRHGGNLAAATSVTFKGTRQYLRWHRATLITTTVPAGASSGKIEVVTPSGSLSGNVPFRVLL